MWSHETSGSQPCLIHEPLGQRLPYCCSSTLVWLMTKLTAFPHTHSQGGEGFCKETAKKCRARACHRAGVCEKNAHIYPGNVHHICYYNAVLGEPDHVFVTETVPKRFQSGSVLGTIFIDNHHFVRKKDVKNREGKSDRLSRISGIWLLPWAPWQPHSHAHFFKKKQLFQHETTAWPQIAWFVVRIRFFCQKMCFHIDSFLKIYETHSRWSDTP